nr:hypothetical protein [Allomuricauda sp.]
MTYKTKSIIYFFCFVFAATAYHITDQYQDFQNQISSQEVTETSFEETSEYDEVSEEELAALPE